MSLDNKGCCSSGRGSLYVLVRAGVNFNKGRGRAFFQVTGLDSLSNLSRSLKSTLHHEHYLDLMCDMEYYQCNKGF